MSDSFTPKLALCQPEVGASTDTWGTKLNSDLAAIDALFNTGPVLSIIYGGTGGGSAAEARTNFGLGTMAVQNAGSVAITGGTLAGITGLTGTFNLSATGAATFGGQVWAQSTGFKFPDGTIQATATLPSGAANWQTMLLTFTTANGGAYYLGAAGIPVSLHSGANNDTVRIVNGFTANYTITPAGGQTIMGSSSLVVDRPYVGLQLACIGTDWRIV